MIPVLEYLLEEEVATHSSIPAWRIIWTESLECYSSWGCKVSKINEGLSTDRQTGRSRSLGGESVQFSSVQSLSRVRLFATP